jgi:hypothetical protein
VVAWEAALQPDCTQPPLPVSLQDASGAALAGHRWRLLPPPAARRMPPNARVHCQLGIVDALLELPSPAARGADADAEAWRAAPGVVWVTLGSLARDGFALQLRLARVASPAATALDGLTGALMLYRLAGGALTLRAAGS